MEVPQHIDDAGVPVVGRTYLVPHADAGDGEWFPVTGPVHTDPEIGNPLPHLHVDERFLTHQHLLALGKPNLKQSTFAVFLLDGEPLAEELRPAVCVRPYFVKKWKPNRIVSLLRPLMKDARLSKCMKCPHRGFDLSHTKVDNNGCVTCPGHGLRWNLLTGECM